MSEFEREKLPITKETLTKEKQDSIQVQKELDFELEIQEQRDNWNS